MAKQMMDVGVTPVMSGGVEVGIDLLVADGDFVVVESTARHMRELILCNTGDFKENPLVGVGAFQYVDDDGFPGDLMAAISEQFSNDGADVKSVKFVGGSIVTDAYYV